MCLAVIVAILAFAYAVSPSNRDVPRARGAPRALVERRCRIRAAGRAHLRQGARARRQSPGRAFVTNVREPGATTRRAVAGALVPPCAGWHDAGIAVARIAGKPPRTTASISSVASDVRNVRVQLSGSACRRVAACRTPDSTRLPKLLRESRVAAWQRGSDELDALFAVLDDRAIADDDALPDTGLTRERERLLSSPFIVSRDYGTRCSTLLALGRDATVHFLERSFNAAGEVTGDVVHRFRIEATQPAIG
jgi:hypothetical protein